VEVRDRAFHGPQIVIISDQIAQSSVNFQVGYKMCHSFNQAGNDGKRALMPIESPHSVPGPCIQQNALFVAA